MTAAVTCQSLGIVSSIQEENAKYLKNWLGAIKKEPKFLYTVLVDVGKASTMIINEVDKCKQKEVVLNQKENEKKQYTDRNVEENSNLSRKQNEEAISPQFKTAVAAAIAGSFQPLLKLKEEGYTLSKKEINTLKDKLDTKGCITAESIFQIKIGIKAGIQKTELNQKNDIQQLTLNF